MKTTPLRFGAGHLAASSIDNRGASAPVRTVDRQLMRVWQYRRLLRSPLFQPFHKVLRPLLRWLFRTPLFVTNDSAKGPPDVQLKPLAIASVGLSALLLPLLFVMLLPLVLILVPVTAFLGLAGALSSTAQAGEDDPEHHSLAWHVTH